MIFHQNRPDQLPVVFGPQSDVALSIVTLFHTKVIDIIIIRISKIHQLLALLENVIFTVGDTR